MLGNFSQMNTSWVLLHFVTNTTKPEQRKNVQTETDKKEVTLSDKLIDCHQICMKIVWESHSVPHYFTFGKEINVMNFQDNSPYPMLQSFCRLLMFLLNYVFPVENVKKLHKNHFVSHFR